MTSPFPLPSSGPLLRRIAMVLGWLSLFATLALLSPGIVATARADEPAAGPSCPIATERAENAAVQLSQTVEQLRADLAERDGGEGDVVVLNTRGYNYGAPADSRLAKPAPEHP